MVNCVWPILYCVLMICRSGLKIRLYSLLMILHLLWSFHPKNTRSDISELFDIDIRRISAWYILCGMKKDQCMVYFMWYEEGSMHGIFYVVCG